MEISGIKNKRTIIVAIALVLLCIFVFWTRYLPAEQLHPDGDYLLGSEPDISYNFRLIEQMLANFPNYPWFEAMTRYPFGTDVRWGPSFTFIVSVLCIIAGATTRPEIAPIAFVAPLLMAVAMVPVMYLIGKALADWKTGLISALFVSVVSGQYLYRSFYGFADHHIAEVLFSTLFCLAYIVALIQSRKVAIDFKNIVTLKIPVLYGIIAGVAYLLGFFTMPTMILFALIVSVFTVIQVVWNHMTERSNEYILVVNASVFITAVIGEFIFGFKDYSLGFTQYTPAHALSCISIVLGTLYLYLLSKWLKEKSPYYYPIAIGGTVLAAGALLLLLLPDIYAMIFGGLWQFFGESATTLTVQEMRPWTLAEAWSTFHFGILLALAGFVVILYNNIADERPEQIFVFVWGIMVLISTFRHVRYEYYLGPVIALLAAVCVGTIISKTWNDAWRFVSKRRKPASPVEEEKEGSKKKGKKEKVKVQAKSYDPVMIGLFFLAAALGILFVGISANYNILVGKAMGYNTMHPDWRETLEWMNGSTPDPGVDYLTIYEKENFRYPPQSYGVMSWWDYGHWITFFAKRIPHANPFQEGAGGLDSASQFFITSDEEDAVRIASNITTRYVVTDIEMDTGKFWAMATWYNETLGASPYQMSFFMTSPQNPTLYELVTLYRQSYFLTMISRLHNFDGSMTTPTSVYYIEYREGTAQSRYIPIITQAKAMEAEAAREAAEAFNRNAPSGYRAVVMSSSLLSPLETVPALRHFRLIHESPTNVLGENGNLSYVKAFEYVKGAHIRGEGVIAIDLMTNTGREFTYRQESVNGEFIVPYSTEGRQYDVTPLSKYRIEGTGITFDVSEEAVMNGYYVN